LDGSYFERRFAYDNNSNSFQPPLTGWQPLFFSSPIQ
jgi:hypothetical protein